MRSAKPAVDDSKDAESGVPASFASLVNVTQLQTMMESLHKVIGTANAVIDFNGDVIAHAGWQELCTKFHRVHPTTCARCRESDTSLANILVRGAPFAIYKCLNGLVDTAAPIVVDNQHLANVFAGQFFTQPADIDFFQKQAREFGFDEQSYMEAVSKVPVVSSERVKDITNLYAQFAQVLAVNGMDRMRQRSVERDLALLNEDLAKRVRDRTQDLWNINNQLKAEQAALRQQKDFLNAILENEPECVKVMGLDGGLMQMNKAGLSMLEVEDFPEAQRLGLLHFVLPEYRSAFRALHKQVCSGQPATLGFEMVGKRGTRRFLETQATPLRDASGTITGLLALTRDITDRKRAESEIERLNADLERRVLERTAQLEAANKELEAFSYSVSHDLRAPLRHLDGYADLLVSHFSEELNETGRHYVAAIADSARQMGVLIDALLRFSRTGRAQMESNTVDMSRLVRETLGSLKEGMPDRSIEWIVQEDLPSVRGDHVLLQQVWVNLLDNAAKYTRRVDNARIEIMARIENGETIFTVKDNGVGFDMQYAHKLFGVFQRLHPASDFEGTGIGLATANRIISRHGGRMWAEGAVNQGASFSFALPVLTS